MPEVTAGSGMQQFLETGAPDGQVRIVVDHREDAQFDRFLCGYGAQVRRTQLEVADFICSARCAVERKTRMDFEASIVDGRLFPQLRNMTMNYPRNILIVEGEESAGNLSREALLGAYSSVITDFGVALFFTRNKESTAEMVFTIAKHEQRLQKQPMRIYAKRKTFTLAQMQRGVVEMLPTVGPKLAKALLEHFGNVENLVTADERALAQVPGLGRKRAKMLYLVLHEKYEGGQDQYEEI